MAKLKTGDHDERLDEQLLSSVANGDLDAFDIIVKRYQDRLLNFVLRFIGEQETAEDIVQETFLRVFRKRKEYRALANFSTWIFTIAGNLAKSELRRRKRWRFMFLDGNEREERQVDIPDESYRPDYVTETEMTSTLIQEAISSLPSHYREVVLLRDVDGMSYQEIAEIVGCPIGTVKSRVNRGRFRLQSKLKRLGYEMDVLDRQDEKP